MSKTRRIAEPSNERWQAYMAGELTIEDMDDEELARGQFRSADGSFRGRPPKTVPRNFMRDVARELLKRGESKIREAYIDAIETLTEIAVSGGKDSDRVRAANLIIERVAGKVPERVVVSEGAPDYHSLVESMLAGEEDEAIERARDILGRR